MENSFIIELRTKLKLTQREFAEALNVSLFTIRNIEQNQRNVPKSLELAILKTFPEYLPKEQKTQKEISNIVALPFYQAKVAAGKGWDMLESPDIEKLYFDRRWLENIIGVKAENCSLVQASGDSMLPQIDDGDLLVVDNSIKTIVNNKTFVIRQDNKFRVKKLRQEISGEILIISNNSNKYPIEKMNKETEIIGQVVWNGSKENV